MIGRRPDRVKPLYERQPLDILRERFAMASDEPSMRSVRLVLRLTDEQLAVREGYLHLRESALIVLIGGGLAAMLVGVGTLIFRMIWYGSIVLLISISLLAAAWQNQREIREMEAEQAAIDDAAAQALAWIVSHLSELEPLDADERRTVRRLVRGRPPLQEAATRLLFEPEGGTDWAGCIL